MNETSVSPPDQDRSASSLFSRLANMFAAPGEVYEEVKAAPTTAANWLAPALILVAVSWVGAGIVFSQDPIKRQVNDLQERAIQRQVDRGKLNEAQAKQARAAIEKFGSLGVKISMLAGPAAVAFAVPFWWGLLLWLTGAKVLKSGFSYMKAVEVAGLANMIGVLDTIVRTLMIIAMGNLFANPGLILLLKDPDASNTLHSILMVLNLMTFWELGVKSVGLARLTGITCARAAAWVFGLWIVFTGFMIGVGVVARSVFGG